VLQEALLLIRVSQPQPGLKARRREFTAKARGFPGASTIHPKAFRSTGMGHPGKAKPRNPTLKREEMKATVEYITKKAKGTAN